MFSHPSVLSITLKVQPLYMEVFFLIALESLLYLNTNRYNDTGIEFCMAEVI